MRSLRALLTSFGIGISRVVAPSRAECRETASYIATVLSHADRRLDLAIERLNNMKAPEQARRLETV